MSIILIIPVIYLVIETVLGYKRGLVKSVLLLLSWIVSIGASAFLVREFAANSDQISQISSLFEGIVGPTMATMAAFVFLFIILMIMLKVFCHIIIKFSGVISDIPVVGSLNKILGGLFGFLKGGMLVFIVFLIYSVYNGKYLDILWQEVPEVMTLIDMAKDYLQQLWTMVM
jgi:membrane protein required for colicin V production